MFAKYSEYSSALITDASACINTLREKKMDVRR